MKKQGNVKLHLLKGKNNNEVANKCLRHEEFVKKLLNAVC